MESEWYQSHFSDRFQLTSDQNVKSRYENDHTGYRVTTSVNGGTTGERCHFTLIDDAHDVNEAESAVVRERTIAWHDEAFFNRINNAKAGGRVIVGQRVHHRDLIGHVKRVGGFDELRIPEEFEPEEPCVTSIGWRDPRTKPGQLLRPELFGPEQVVEAQRRLGTFGYGSQHQQRPVPREGALFKLAWFKRFRRVVDLYHIQDHQPLVMKNCWRFIIMDPAGGESESADNTAIGVFDVTPKLDLLLVLMIRERIPLENIPKRLKLVCDEWEPEFVGIETGFFQGKIVKEARRIVGMPPVREIDPGGKDKLARAIPAVVRAEAGQIYLPEEAHWLPAFLEELAVFTGQDDARDDQVDVLSYASAEMHKREKKKSSAPSAHGGRP